MTIPIANGLFNARAMSQNNDDTNKERSQKNALKSKVKVSGN